MDSGILWHAKGTVVMSSKFWQKKAAFATTFGGAFVMALASSLHYDVSVLDVQSSHHPAPVMGHRTADGDQVTGRVGNLLRAISGQVMPIAI